MRKRKSTQNSGADDGVRNKGVRRLPEDMAMNGVHGLLVKGIPVVPLNVDAEIAAAMIGISPAHFYAQLGQGLIPPGSRMGRRRLWSVYDLRCWVLAGMPTAERWAAIKDDCMKSLN